jgi:hypothetical protein
MPCQYIPQQELGSGLLRGFPTRREHDGPPRSTPPGGRRPDGRRARRPSRRCCRLARRSLRWQRGGGELRARLADLIVEYLGCGCLVDPAADDRDASAVRVELVAGDKIAIAILDETPEARAFAAMLPITVDLEDPFGQAKTGRLPGALDVEVATRSRSYAAGDLSYWSPSGSLAVVYDALGRSVPPPGLVRLGRVQTGLEAVVEAGNEFAMTIRHAPKEDR